VKKERKIAMSDFTTKLKPEYSTPCNIDAIELNADGYKLYVSFLTGRVVIGKQTWNQQVTTCIIRTYDEFGTFTGVAICNPNDLSNFQKDRQVAFKRALQEFLFALDVSISYEKELDTKFRQQLFEAMYIQEQEA
jgi:hypothetical protein